MSRPTYTISGIKTPFLADPSKAQSAWIAWKSSWYHHCWQLLHLIKSSYQNSPRRCIFYYCLPWSPFPVAYKSMQCPYIGFLFCMYSTQNLNSMLPKGCCLAGTNQETLHTCERKSYKQERNKIKNSDRPEGIKNWRSCNKQREHKLLRTKIDHQFELSLLNNLLVSKN